MQSLDTEYKGYKFRSRLEARWAVFFDICNVSWEYEPEGYDLGNENYYLPDFLLHDITIIVGEENYKIDLYAEVKGKMTNNDSKKIAWFYSDNNFNIINPIIILGNIPYAKKIADIYKHIDYDEDEYEYANKFFNFYFIDYNNCGAYPCLDKKGNFIILDENKLRDRIMDFRTTQKAYKLAQHINFKYVDLFLSNRKEFWKNFLKEKF